MEPYQPSINGSALSAILEDLSWWRAKLSVWSGDTQAKGDYHILSGSEILANADKVVLLQSDASGDDGFGYHTSYLNSREFKWTSKRWPQNFHPAHSHQAELLALEDFLMFQDISKTILIIWISDCEAACWSVNKGNCKDPFSLKVLKHIYDLLDASDAQIVAIWIPREENELSDYLSHLSVILNRDEVYGQGRFSN